MQHVLGRVTWTGEQFAIHKCLCHQNDHDDKEVYHGCRIVFDQTKKSLHKGWTNHGASRGPHDSTEVLYVVAVDDAWRS